MLKRMIFIFMASLLLPFLGAAQEGVKWENCTFEQALQKASQENRLALDYRTPCAPKTMDLLVVSELIFNRTEIPEKVKLKFIKMRGKVCHDDVKMLTDLYNRYREENK